MALVYWLILAVGIALTVWYGWSARIGWNTGASWALLALAHGLVFKPLFVAFAYPSMELIEATLLQKISLDEYWVGSVVVLFPYAIFVSCMFAAGGYRQRRAPRPTPTRAVRFSERALVALLLVALAGFVAFFVQFPQLLESANKNSIATSDIADYSSGGIWRSLVELAYVVSLCALLNAGRPSVRTRNLILFLVAAALWLSFCFLSDQRGLMMFSVVTYLLSYGRFVGAVPKRVVIVIGLILVSAIIGKSIMRLQAETGEAQEDVAAVAANFIGQNLVENGKTVSIIKAVPDTLDFQFGKTYLDSILILVPRALFPEKTTVNLDTVIGNKVFECDAFGACGVPPGMIAESYLNFGPLGVIVCAVLFGTLVGKVDAHFRRVGKGGLFDLFFLYSFIYCGMAILGSGVSGVITQVVTQSGELLLIWLVAGRARPARPRSSAVGSANVAARPSSL